MNFQPRVHGVDDTKSLGRDERRGWQLYVDNIFASPINQTPFALGADVVQALARS